MHLLYRKVRRARGQLFYVISPECVSLAEVVVEVMVMVVFVTVVVELFVVARLLVVIVGVVWCFCLW